MTCSPIAARFVASSARADLDPSRADGRLASLGAPGRREHAVGRGRQHGLEVTETFKVTEAGLDELTIAS